MDDFDNEHDDSILIDTICAGCDLAFPVNDLGLCDDCFAKLERDLIRARDWKYSATAFMVSEDQLETLRERIIRDYGADYELIVAPKTPKLKRKNKRSKSWATQRKREIAAKARRDYNTDDVLQSARDFILKSDTEWVNFSRLSQYLYETFYKLKPKHLGKPGKKHKSLLKFLADYPSDFELRQGPEKKGLYWVRLK
jgi:hypothetical protein